jgi:hypothetical protein
MKKRTRSWVVAFSITPIRRLAKNYGSILLTSPKTSRTSTPDLVGLTSNWRCSRSGSTHEVRERADWFHSYCEIMP